MCATVVVVRAVLRVLEHGQRAVDGLGSVGVAWREQPAAVPPDQQFRMMRALVNQPEQRRATRGQRRVAQLRRSARRAADSLELAA